MDAEKNKKLQQYAVALTEQAKEEEKSGKSDEAIKHYLKLVDVFLVLAAELRIITLGFSIFAKLKRTRLGRGL